MSRATQTTTFLVPLQAPLDLAPSLRPLGRFGDDGIDRWDGSILARTVRVAADLQPTPYAATVAGSIEQPRLRVETGDAHAHESRSISEAIASTFLAAPRELAELAAADERVAHLIALHRAIVPILFPDPFTALIRSISAQQVNLRWAATIRRRLAERYGVRHAVAGTYVYSLEPAPLARATIDELRALQLTTAKARSVIACGEAGVAGELERAALSEIDDDRVIEHLTKLRGIGLWSAEWFLARTLGRPRVVAGDLGVRKAVGRLYETAGLPSESEVRVLTEHWGASATFVQALALHDFAVASGVA